MGKWDILSFLSVAHVVPISQGSPKFNSSVLLSDNGILFRHYIINPVAPRKKQSEKWPLWYCATCQGPKGLTKCHSWTVEFCSPQSPPKGPERNGMLTLNCWNFWGSLVTNGEMAHNIWTWSPRGRVCHFLRAVSEILGGRDKGQHFSWGVFNQLCDLGKVLALI